MSVSLIAIAMGMLVQTDTPETGFARFSGNSHIKVVNSEKMLDTHKDFTVEVWARFQKTIDDQYFASNYALQGGRVAYNSGWALRKRRERDSRGRPRKGGADRLEFTFGSLEGSWTSLLYKFKPSGGVVHIAVCRSKETLRMYVNGRPVARRSLRGVTIMKSPKAVFVGGRPDLPNRHFRGDVAAFRILSYAKYDTTIFKPRLPQKADDRCLVMYNFSQQKLKTKAIDHSQYKRNGSLFKVELHLPSGAVTAGTPTKAKPTDRLAENGKLKKGDSIKSPNGKFELKMNPKGSLTLWRVADSKVLWSTPTGGRGEYLQLQGDGNLIVFNAKRRPIWTTRTAGHKGTQLVIRDNGNVVLFKGKRALWSTGTRR